MKEEKLGWRIETLPDKIKVSAITQEGLLGLNEMMGTDKKGGQLRSKLRIDRNEWPYLTYDQMNDGKIFRVIFTKELV